MKRFIPYYILALVVAASSCKTTGNIGGVKDDGKIEAVFVLVNDVYEIAPLSGGKEGGMARVATLKKEYLRVNPNTYLVMAGDFLSPSVYNSLPYEGKAIRGKQMVEAMNAAGIDIAVFGNHEFDIKESELQDRIDESQFQWVASNTFHKEKEKIGPFVKRPTGQAIPRTYAITVKDSDGTTAKIGVIGLTLPANRTDYVQYTDALTTAKELYNGLKDTVDAVVAITHQFMREDEQLAREIPQLAVILGGHEHDMKFKKEGPVFITKAHSNARSAYVVKLNIDKKNGVQVTPELRYINESIALDSVTNRVVQKWVNIAEKNYSVAGFDARRVIIAGGDSLNALETYIRSGETNFSRLIINAMTAAAPAADVVVFNSGSIRLDDILRPPVTQYDIIRALPFGGGIREVDMKGSLLVKVLATGKKNIGIGGYLQHSKEVAFDTINNIWKDKNGPIDTAKIYRVAMPDFLLTGKEFNLDFLNPANPEIVKVYDAVTDVSDPRADIRLAIIRYLEKMK